MTSQQFNKPTGGESMSVSYASSTPDVRNDALPVELLYEIFTIAAQSIGVSNRQKVNKSLLPTVLGTCRLWRIVALSMPCLWRIIDFRCVQKDDSLEVSSWEELEMHLVLSKDATLDLLVLAQITETALEAASTIANLPIASAMQRFHYLLRPHRSRIQRLDITEGDLNLRPSAQPMGANGLANAASNATYLERHLGLLGGIAFPCLRVLLTNSASWAMDEDQYDSRSFSYIQHLDIAGVAKLNQPSMLAVLRIVNLRYLRIIQVHVPLFITLDLPHLIRLAIILPMHQRHVICALTTPKLEHLQVSSHGRIRFNTPLVEDNTPDGTIGVFFPAYFPRLQSFQVLRCPGYDRQHQLPRFIAAHSTSLEILSLPIMQEELYVYRLESPPVALHFIHIIITFAGGKDDKISDSDRPQTSRKHKLLRIVQYPGSLATEITVRQYIKQIVEVALRFTNLSVELVGGFGTRETPKERWGDLVKDVAERWSFVSGAREDLFSEWFDTAKLDGI